MSGRIRAQVGDSAKNCDKRLTGLVAGQSLQGSPVWPLVEKKREGMCQALGEAPEIAAPFHRPFNPSLNLKQGSMLASLTRHRIYTEKQLWRGFGIV